MKHYFIGQFRWGVAHLIADDETVLTVDASALPAGLREGADVCLEHGRFGRCPEREAHRADLFRTIRAAVRDKSGPEGDM